MPLTSLIDFIVDYILWICSLCNTWCGCFGWRRPDLSTHMSTLPHLSQQQFRKQKIIKRNQKTWHSLADSSKLLFQLASISWFQLAHQVFCMTTHTSEVACPFGIRCPPMSLTAAELARFDGEARPEIYISFNGKVRGCREGLQLTTEIKRLQEFRLSDYFLLVFNTDYP